MHEEQTGHRASLCRLHREIQQALGVYDVGRVFLRDRESRESFEVCRDLLEKLLEMRLHAQ